ncbi:DMT family transporter [Ruania albidiflava]|uniref:DMT family transporter n=1 Tax=Ruania albidiflava TaxID=366586 RepID=UPI0003B33925|nr:SMR family transporter [Ruania albidiflava]
MALLLLAGAILAEVTGTVSLRMAATGSRRWFLPVAVSYLLAFTLLSAALGHGMGIAVAYGIWSATGVAITAVLSKVLFDEPLTPLMALGISLIVGGVLLIEVGAGR